MTDKQLDILRHSLGIENPRTKEPYRNFYCAALGNSEVMTDINSLVSAGMMFAGKKINDGSMQYFHVSDEGRAETLAKTPKLKRSRGQERYHQYLRISDVIPGLTFGDYLRGLKG